MKLTKDLNSYIDSSSIYSNYITSSFNRYIKYFVEKNKLD